MLGNITDALASNAQALYRGAQFAAEAVEGLPAPAKYAVYAGLGGLASVAAAPLAVPAFLGTAFGVGAAGPVAGGIFAGFQAAAGGAIAAGAPLAVIQGIAMGAPLPAVGYVGASAAGAAVAAGARAGVEAVAALWQGDNTGVVEEVSSCNNPCESCSCCSDMEGRNTFTTPVISSCPSPEGSDILQETISL